MQFRHQMGYGIVVLHSVKTGCWGQPNILYWVTEFFPGPQIGLDVETTINDLVPKLRMRGAILYSHVPLYGMLHNLLNARVPNAKARRETLFEIHFVYLSNKRLYCILRPATYVVCPKSKCTDFPMYELAM